MAFFEQRSWNSGGAMQGFHEYPQQMWEEQIGRLLYPQATLASLSEVSSAWAGHANPSLAAHAQANQPWPPMQPVPLLLASQVPRQAVQAQAQWDVSEENPQAPQWHSLESLPSYPESSGEEEKKDNLEVVEKVKELLNESYAKSKWITFCVANGVRFSSQPEEYDPVLLRRFIGFCETDFSAAEEAVAAAETEAPKAAEGSKVKMPEPSLTKNTNKIQGAVDKPLGPPQSFPEALQVGGPPGIIRLDNKLQRASGAPPRPDLTALPWCSPSDPGLPRCNGGAVPPQPSSKGAAVHPSATNNASMISTPMPVAPGLSAANSTKNKPLVECMRKLFQDGTMPFDVRIVVDDGFVSAHRFFLASRSLFFEMKLQGSARAEPWQPMAELPLPGITSDVLKHVLLYIYTDEIDYSLEDHGSLQPQDLEYCIHLCEVADYLGLRGLTRLLHNEVLCPVAETMKELNLVKERLQREQQTKAQNLMDAAAHAQPLSRYTSGHFPYGSNSPSIHDQSIHRLPQGLTPGLLQPSVNRLDRPVQ